MRNGWRVACVATIVIGVAIAGAGGRAGAQEQRPQTAPGPTQAAAPASAAGLEALSGLDWLAGAWEGPFRDGRWEAVYSSPTGGEILSASKELAGGRVRMFEFERFRAVGDEVVLTPYPHGRPARDFRLREQDRARRRAVFENPENDFPRQIVYQREGEDVLRIELLGERSGAEVRWVMELRRRS